MRSKYLLIERFLSVDRVASSPYEPLLIPLSSTHTRYTHRSVNLPLISKRPSQNLKHEWTPPTRNCARQGPTRNATWLTPRPSPLTWRSELGPVYRLRYSVLVRLPSLTWELITTSTLMLTNIKTAITTTTVIVQLKVPITSLNLTYTPSLQLCLTHGLSRLSAGRRLFLRLMLQD